MTDALKGLIAAGFGYLGCEPRGELLGPQWGLKSSLAPLRNVAFSGKPAALGPPRLRRLPVV